MAASGPLIRALEDTAAMLYGMAAGKMSDNLRAAMRLQAQKLEELALTARNDVAKVAAQEAANG